MKDIYKINSSNTAITTDADMREIISGILYGTEFEKPRGRFIVIQNLRRDSLGRPIQSPYSYKVTGEGKDAHRGPNTTRTGYLCDEILVRGMIRPAGRRMLDEFPVPMGQYPALRDLLVLAWDSKIEKDDTVVIVKIDDNGDLIQPVQIEDELIVTHVYKMTSDYGRIEYKIAVMEKEK